MKRALITGITGQDGAYLARLLLQKGYQVWGTTRGGAAPGPLDALRVRDSVRLIPVDYGDEASLNTAVETSNPEEIYNLAAQSSVGNSFQEPLETARSAGMNAVRVLDVARRRKPDARFFQASTAELFGVGSPSPQSEETPFHPSSPYGAAKAFAHTMTSIYRQAYNLQASCGILFNHESPLRPERFVTRKISLAVARIYCGLQSSLTLGNLEVWRDWGFAGDYVEAIWRMLQQPEPADYVVATGAVHSLRELVEKAFSSVGLRAEEYLSTDPALLRPVDSQALVGDPRRAKEKLGWEAVVNFDCLVQLMVEADIHRVRGEEEAIRYVPEGYPD